MFTYQEITFAGYSINEKIKADFSKRQQNN